MDRRGIMKIFAAALLIGINTAVKAADSLGPMPERAIQAGVELTDKPQSQLSYLTKKLFAAEQVKKLGYSKLYNNRFRHNYSTPNKYEVLKSVSPMMKSVLRQNYDESNCIDREIANLKERIWREGAMAMPLPEISSLIRD